MASKGDLLQLGMFCYEVATLESLNFAQIHELFEEVTCFPEHAHYYVLPFEVLQLDMYANGQFDD